MRRPVTITIDSDLWDRAMAIAFEDDTKISYIIEGLLRRLVKSKDRKDRRAKQGTTVCGHGIPTDEPCSGCSRMTGWPKEEEKPHE